MPRPKFPHLADLSKAPQVLTVGPVTVSEKIHGTSVRVGRDSDGVLWYGSRNQDFNFVSDDVTDGLWGFRDHAEREFSRLTPGITLYGEWAGRGVMGGIDYGEKRFYVFAERIGDGPVVGTAAVLDSQWLSGATIVPVLYEGSDVREEFLRAFLDEGSVAAPGQPMEGVVVAPMQPVFDVYGHQVIAKIKSPRFSELSSQRLERAPADLTTVTAFAEEWVNLGRVEHALQQVQEAKLLPAMNDALDVTLTGDVLRAVYADVVRESGDGHAALSNEDQGRLGKAVNRESLAYLKALRELRDREAVKNEEKEATA